MKLGLNYFSILRMVFLSLCLSGVTLIFAFVSRNPNGPTELHLDGLAFVSDDNEVFVPLKANDCVTRDSGLRIVCSRELVGQSLVLTLVSSDPVQDLSLGFGVKSGIECEVMYNNRRGECQSRVVDPAARKLASVSIVDLRMSESVVTRLWLENLSFNWGEAEWSGIAVVCTVLLAISCAMFTLSRLQTRKANHFVASLFCILRHVFHQHKFVDETAVGLEISGLDLHFRLSQAQWRLRAQAC